MRARGLRLAVACAAMVVGSQAGAQTQAPAAAAPPYALDAIPDKMPFSQPYGAPITLQRAQDAIQAAMAEAAKRGWPLNIAVVDSGANLVAFARMEGALLASIAISEHKARTSVKFRRPTRAFEDAIQKSDYKYVLSLDDVVASRGGILLIDDGKIIGAIGCSGATGSQDEVVCAAGAAAINK